MTNVANQCSQNNEDGRNSRKNARTFFCFVCLLFLVCSRKLFQVEKNKNIAQLIQRLRVQVGGINNKTKLNW
ncbi:MAG: hypothetical protein CL915_14775 [Deltaproteobacteria bacterium]|nr:hypothetical protein [Deltaproteobacteria bacterium]